MSRSTSSAKGASYPQPPGNRTDACPIWQINSLAFLIEPHPIVQRFYSPCRFWCRNQQMLDSEISFCSEVASGIPTCSSCFSKLAPASYCQPWTVMPFLPKMGQIRQLHITAPRSRLPAFLRAPRAAVIPSRRLRHLKD